MCETRGLQPTIVWCGRRVEEDRRQVGWGFGGRDCSGPSTAKHPQVRVGVTGGHPALKPRQPCCRERADPWRRAGGDYRQAVEASAVCLSEGRFCLDLEGPAPLS